MRTPLIHRLCLGLLPLSALAGCSDAVGTGDVATLVWAAGILLVLLALFGIVFAALGIANKDQALALPEGSVRALLALLLVLMFAVMMGSQSNKLGDQEQRSVVKSTELAEFTKGRSVSKVAPLVAAAASAAGCADGACYEVLLLVPASAAQIKFTDQLMAALVTLITSVVSFYFGARVVASAAAAGSAPAAPTVGSIEVKPAASGVTTREFILHGSGLVRLKQLELLAEGAGVGKPLVLTPQSTSDKDASFSVAVPATGTPTRFKLVALDDAGNRLALTQVLDLS